MSSTEDIFTQLYELLLAHQRAYRRGHEYYCWRSQAHYNWLKRQEQEHIYHSAMHQARCKLDEENVRRRTS